MRKMKDSGIEWIGEIPFDKEIIKNKYLVKYIKGRIPNETNTDKQGLPYIGASDLDDASGGCEYSLFTDDMNVPQCNCGDVLILWDGARAGLIGTNHNGAISSTIVNAIPDETINKRFWYWYLKGFEKYLYECVNGTTIPHMNRKYIDDICMLNWTHDEQSRIADFLDDKCDKIDQYIGKQQQIIEKLKEYKQSVITEAVTKGLDPDARMKDSGLRYSFSIPSHWENRKVISILDMRVVDGAHESPELFDQGIPYISATAIENGKIDFSKMRGYISEEYCNICDQRYKPAPNDILMIKLGASTGQVAIVETTQRFNIWVPLAAIRCNRTANPKFVYYALQSDYFIKQMELSWTYGTQQTLGVKTIERLRIILPPLNEQIEIANHLSVRCESIDSSINNCQNIINKLNEYKKSLIYETVTGKYEI